MKIKLKEIILLPNLISLFRLMLFIPFLYLLVNLDKKGYRNYVLILIFVAFISDLLDGYVARKKNMISEFGKIIDPLADKILVAIIIINLYLNNAIPIFYFWIVILRDAAILFGGIFVSNRIGKVLPSNLLGKFAVFSIGIFIIIILLQIEKNSVVYTLILDISCFLCIASFIGYIIRAIDVLTWKKNENIP